LLCGTEIHLQDLATKTKSVVHIVDGIHRLTALKYALVFPKAMNICMLDLKIKAYLPTELSPDFVSQMQTLSNQTQTQLGCLKDHGRREFYSCVIGLLDKECRRHGADKFMIDPDGAQQISTLQEDIETFAPIVLDVLVNGLSCQYFTLVPEIKLSQIQQTIKNKDNKDEVLCILFQNKKSNKWTLHWDEGIYALHRSIGRYKENMHYWKQYEKGESIPSSLFELVQVLMWTCISRASHRQLSNFLPRTLPA
jgi:hypothetical protein